jgi:hypothetical protein
VETYIDMDGTIKSEGNRTLHGKYSDAEFQSFLNVATGRNILAPNSQTTVDWKAAKSRFEGLLRSILIENFYRNNIKRRLALTCRLLLALCGYVLLLIPSVDLFAKVIRVTLRGVA